MPDYGYRKLSHPIVPFSGPLRPTRTVAEIRTALREHLPEDLKRYPHWQTAIALVEAAGQNGSRGHIRAATDQLMRAFDREGWLT